VQLSVRQHEQEALPHGPRLLASTAEEHRGLELLELLGGRPGARPHVPCLPTPRARVKAPGCAGAEQRYFIERG